MKKDFGFNSEGRPLHEYNIKLDVEYLHKRLGKVKREAVFTVVAVDRLTAGGYAIEKAKKQMSYFDYITDVKIEVKPQRRKKDGA